MNFCFLEVNLCEMRSFKTMNCPHFEKWFSGFNSKQTLSMAEHMYDRSAFLSTGSFPTLRPVLRTWLPWWFLGLPREL